MIHLLAFATELLVGLPARSTAFRQHEIFHVWKVFDVRSHQDHPYGSATFEVAGTLEASACYYSLGSKTTLRT